MLLYEKIGFRIHCFFLLLWCLAQGSLPAACFGTEQVLSSNAVTGIDKSIGLNLGGDPSNVAHPFKYQAGKVWVAQKEEGRYTQTDTSSLPSAKAKNITALSASSRK